MQDLRTLRQLGLLLRAGLGLARAVQLVAGDDAARQLADGKPLAAVVLAGLPAPVDDLLDAAMRAGTTGRTLNRLADGHAAGHWPGRGLRTFTYFLAEFIAAGATFPRAFSALSRVDLEPRLAALPLHCLAAIDDGHNVCDGLDQLPGVVPAWYRAVFREFEVAGRPTDVTFDVLLAGLADDAFGAPAP